MMKQNKIDRLWIWLFSLNFIDMLLTLHGISLGAVEINPIMNWIMSHSMYLFITVKVTLIPLLYLKYRKLDLSFPLKLLILIYAGVIINNLHVIGTL